MAITEEKPQTCEMCGKVCQEFEKHHIIHRGMAAGKKMECRINKIRLGSSFECACHYRYHNSGEIQPEDFMRKVAERDGLNFEDVETVLIWLRWLPKEPYLFQLEKRLEELTEVQQGMAKQALSEMKRKKRKAKPMGE